MEKQAWMCAGQIIACPTTNLHAQLPNFCVPILVCRQMGKTVEVIPWAENLALNEYMVNNKLYKEFIFL